ncbi:hypothetical protein, partial [Stenotrophomonas sp. NPDC077659]|uniref:hypothetical protein n=1 Tax=Stenotrophomonas sp. NPDC077659 TaxID=3390694 RepID=UPI003D020255
MQISLLSNPGPYSGLAACSLSFRRYNVRLAGRDPVLLCPGDSMPSVKVRAEALSPRAVLQDARGQVE